MQCESRAGHKALFWSMSLPHTLYQLPYQQCGCILKAKERLETQIHTTECEKWDYFLYIISYSCSQANSQVWYPRHTCQPSWWRHWECSASHYRWHADREQRAETKTLVTGTIPLLFQAAIGVVVQHESTIFQSLMSVHYWSYAHIHKGEHDLWIFSIPTIHQIFNCPHFNYHTVVFIMAHMIHLLRVSIVVLQGVGWPFWNWARLQQVLVGVSGIFFESHR